MRHDFVWADWYTVVDNPQYAAPLRDSLRTTQHDHLDGTLMGTVGLPVAYESYRPLLFASFKLDDTWFARAAWANLSGGRIEQGSSTIPQQTVKNVLLTPERTWSRKG